MLLVTTGDTTQMETTTTQMMTTLETVDATPTSELELETISQTTIVMVESTTVPENHHKGIGKQYFFMRN